MAVSVNELHDALGKIGIKEFVRRRIEEEITEEGFQNQHKGWCGEIVKFLYDSDVSGDSKLWYGRAAKLVAMYLKGMVVVGHHSKTPLARIAHPPIDSILLDGIARCDCVPAATRRLCRSTAWTKLDSDRYYSLIKEIKANVPDIDPFWRLERYWHPKSAAR